MTSEKKLFNSHFFVDSIKRYWYLGFIAFLGYFFLMTNRIMMKIQDYSIGDTNRMRFFEEFSVSYDATIIYCIGALVAAIIFSLVLFNFMHNKRQVNFFHSQPIRREALIIVRYLTALIYFAAALALNYILSCLIMAFGGVGETINIIELLGQFGYIFLLFAVIMGFGALSAVLCGTTFAQSELLVLMLFAPPAVYWCFVMLCDTLLATFYPGSAMDTAAYLSPFLYFILKCGSVPYDSAIMSLGGIALYIALTALLLGLSVGIYKKSPVERAGMPLLFKPTRPIVKYTACFIAASLMSMIFSMMASFEFMLFGAVIGGWLCHIFCESQFNRDIRAMFKNTIGFIIFSVLMIALICGLAFDITGFNKSTPDASNVKSVRLYNYDRNSYFISENGKMRWNNLETSRAYESREFIELACALSSEMGKDAISTNISHWLPGESSDNLIYFEIEFELQNGSTMYRKYSAAKNSIIFELYNKIVNLEEYKRGYGVFQITDVSNGMEIWGEETIKGKLASDNIIDKEKSQILLEAAKQDILDSTKMLASGKVGEVNVRSPQQAYSFTIHDDYKRTKDLLIQWGILKEYTYEECLEIYSSVTITWNDGKTLTIMPDEKERFKEILDCSMNYEANIIDSRFYVQFELKSSDNRQKDQEFNREVVAPYPSTVSSKYMAYDNIPEFVKDYFEIE